MTVPELITFIDHEFMDPKMRYVGFVCVVPHPEDARWVYDAIEGSVPERHPFGGGATGDYPIG